MNIEDNFDIKYLDILIAVDADLKEEDDKILAFAEWSDQRLNAEKWDLPKSTDKSGQSQPDHLLYKDSQLVILPYVQPHDWKRPSEVFPNTEIILYKDSNNFTDLICGSKHLIKSKFVRRFITSINNLEYISTINPWQMEEVSSTYIPTTENNPWRPWHHVYSMCKAGKGQTHRPQINRSGKYITRLYWFGGWKEIIVDDLLPIDNMGHVLLPSTVDHHELLTNPKKGQQVELWPFILLKALCKIGILTCEKGEMINFSFLTPFTGWMSQRLSAINLSKDECWAVFKKYSLQYKWPEKVAAREKGKGAKKGKQDTTGKSQDNVKIHLLATTFTTDHLRDDDIPGITPIISMSSYICETRDIPLEKPPDLPELPRWKKFRWLPWAIENGLWSDSGNEHIRYIKLAEAFKHVNEIVVYDEIEFTNLMKNVNQKQLESLSTKKGKSESDKKSKDKSKSEKSSKKSKESKKSKNVKLPDISTWIDFYSIVDHLMFFTLNFIPSKFLYWQCVTNIEKYATTNEEKPKKQTKGKDTPKDAQATGNNKTYYHYATSLKVSRNEPFYCFIDSDESEHVFIDCQIFGHGDLLNKVDEDESATSKLLDEMRVCNIRQCPELFDVTEEIFDVHVSTKRPLAKFVITEYKWNRRKSGKMVLTGVSVGDQGYTIEIKPGRTIYEIYLLSMSSYYFHILSDAPIVVGTEHRIIEEMSKESSNFLNKIYKISNCFGKLVKAFGTEDYATAMREFVASLKPKGTKLTKNESTIIWENFLNHLREILDKHYKNDELHDVNYSLKILFLDRRFLHNKNIKCFSLKPSFELCTCGITDSKMLMMEKLKERSAAKLQAFLKGLYIRKLLSYHQNTHKNHMQICTNLRNIYMRLFTVTKLDEILLPFYRNLLFTDDMESIVSLYDFYDDLKNTVNLMQFNGEICVISDDEWAAISKHVLFCNSDNGILLKILFTCDLPQYEIKIYDNDTGQEIKNQFNNVLLERCRKNRNGYTIITYGWLKDTKTVQWKLSFVTEKLSSSSNNYIDVRQINITQDVIVYNYIPNLYNIISRFILKIKGNSSLTFRISVSTENVKLKLVCRNDSGKLFSQTYGTSNLIIPIIFLDGEVTLHKSSSVINKSTSVINKSSSVINKLSSVMNKSSNHSKKSMTSNVSVEETIYIVEAFVVDNSWPLSLAEWQVADTKRNYFYYYTVEDPSSNESVTNSKLKYRKTSTSDYLDDKEEIERPYFKFYLVHDGNATCAIDWKGASEVRKMKEEWYEDDPTRFEKSIALRNKFIEKYKIKSEESNERQINMVSNPEIFKCAKTAKRNLSKLRQFFLEDYYNVPLTSVDFFGRTLISKISDQVEEVRVAKYKIFEEINEMLLENRDNWLEMQTDDNNILNNWYSSIKLTLSDKMKSTYDLREKILRDLDEVRKEKKPKEKTGKKKK